MKVRAFGQPHAEVVGETVTVTLPTLDALQTAQTLRSLIAARRIPPGAIDPLRAIADQLFSACKVACVERRLADAEKAKERYS